jgi:hypothetical protein
MTFPYWLKVPPVGIVPGESGLVLPAEDQVVIAIRVDSEDAKQALVADESTPFFTTSHFDGYPSVLVRASRLGEITRQGLVEVIAEAWLARAPKRLAAGWLEEHPDGPPAW